jgi:hypothetical protein
MFNSITLLNGFGFKEKNNGRRRNGGVETPLTARNWTDARCMELGRFGFGRGRNIMSGTASVGVVAGWTSRADARLGNGRGGGAWDVGAAEAPGCVRLGVGWRGLDGALLAPWSGAGEAGLAAAAGEERLGARALKRERE